MTKYTGHGPVCSSSVSDQRETIGFKISTPLPQHASVVVKNSFASKNDAFPVQHLPVVVLVIGINITLPFRPFARGVPSAALLYAPPTHYFEHYYVSLAST